MAVIKAKDLEQALRNNGWKESRQRDSHSIWYSPSGKHISLHTVKREYDKGILKQKMRAIGYDLKTLLI